MIGGLLFLLSLGATAGRSIDAATGKRIRDDVHAVLDRTHTPGAVVLVVAGGKPIFEEAYGQRDVANKLPVGIDTHFEIGSITKQFTAAAILQLQEAGKLHIEDRLSVYLPKAPHADEITLKQMLSHTSGLPEYLDGPDIEVAARKPTDFARILQRIDGKSLVFVPGSQWSYNNSGYLLLGRVIETVSRETYRHYLQAHIFLPLGMRDTFTVSDESHLPNMALGYTTVDGTVQTVTPWDESYASSAGSIVSTVGDLQKWNDALTTGKVISPQSYALMSSSVMTGQGDAEYGLGLFVDQVEDQPRIGHTGGSAGFTTANEYFPKQGVRIIAFTNHRANPEPGEMLTTAIFNDLYPGIAAAALHPSAGEDVAVSVRVRALFTQLQSGQEGSAALGAKLDAKMKDGLAKRLSDAYAPYGKPTAFTFKGRRTTPGRHWFDYVIQFGPGSLLKFGVGLDEEGKIAGLSFG